MDGMCPQVRDWRYMNRKQLEDCSACNSGSQFSLLHKGAVHQQEPSNLAHHFWYVTTVTFDIAFLCYLEASLSRNYNKRKISSYPEDQYSRHCSRYVSHFSGQIMHVQKNPKGRYFRLSCCKNPCNLAHHFTPNLCIILHNCHLSINEGISLELHIHIKHHSEPIFRNL